MTSQHGVNSNPQSGDTLNISTLRTRLIKELGLTETLHGQLVPENFEDFQSDWTHTVDQILALLKDTMNEVIGADEKLSNEPWAAGVPRKHRPDITIPGRNELRAAQRAKLERLIGR